MGATWTVLAAPLTWFVWMDVVPTAKVELPFASMMRVVDGPVLGSPSLWKSAVEMMPRVEQPLSAMDVGRSVLSGGHLASRGVALCLPSFERVAGRGLD